VAIARMERNASVVNFMRLLLLDRKKEKEAQLPPCVDFVLIVNGSAQAVADVGTELS
jgi:hypothetical protein